MYSFCLLFIYYSFTRAREERVTVTLIPLFAIQTGESVLLGKVEGGTPLRHVPSLFERVEQLNDSRTSYTLS